MQSKIIDLPSGKKLEVQPAPFLDARALYQAFLEEAKAIKIDSGDFGVENVIKDVFCTGLSSKRIEAALDKCSKRALYDGLPITNDTFEPVEAREDYIPALMAITEENIRPFTKSLYAQFRSVLAQLQAQLRVQA